MTRAEGRWTSLEGHGLYEHKSAGGAAYRAVLRREVRERLPWVGWRKVGRGLFEIDGVPQAVLREFSRRRVEIEERARQLTGVAASMLSRDRLQGIALATRKAKEYAVDGARWHEEARARAAEHGLGARGVRRLRSGKGVLAASEADVVRTATARLSGPTGLTEQHNTFARRHALAELAGEFEQGASMTELERSATAYLQDGTVVGVGRIDHEGRFTTVDLLAREQAIVEGAERRSAEQAGVVHARLPELVVTDLSVSLNDEQLAAVRSIATDGAGVSALQALAGTGKTRVLGALARVYEAAGHRVIGVAPTGRAARELADSAGVPAFTIHQLVSELDASGGFAPNTVVLFDEAGTAPTRPSADLFERAERDGAKVIVVRDSGQLPSVAAGGWFRAVAQSLGGPELRQVMRQHDPAEREALEARHDGDPEQYLGLKRERSELAIHAFESDALAAILGDWNEARGKHGLGEAVMIARDNATRAMLNEHARELLVRDGVLQGEGVVIADQEFRVGDRVIARRNDRYRDIDNGMLATVSSIDRLTGALRVATESGSDRVLDASYASEHLEHAYALTGHGAHGATVEWAGVIGRPSEFTREWAYTSLSRARERTRVYVIGEPTAGQREREEYAPLEPRRTKDQPLNLLSLSMRRREAERLALDAVEPQHPPAAQPSAPSPARSSSSRKPVPRSRGGAITKAAVSGARPRHRPRAVIRPRP
jgi:hypothetical protein